MFAAVVGGLYGGPGAAGAELPDPQGLVVWLDATQTNAVTRGADGVVQRWASRAPASLVAVPPEAVASPRWVPDAWGPGRSAVRFDGAASLDLPQLAVGRGPLTVFVVFRRGDAQAGGTQWQRLVSAWDGTSANDTQGASVMLDTNGTAEPMRPRVFVGSFSGVERGSLTLGRNQRGGDPLHGDIAELLVYERGFLVDEQFEKVQTYLSQKWGVVADPRDDWTRARPLGETPERVSDRLPLSDQANAGRWVPLEPFWDGFAGEGLDNKLWFDHNPRWYGRVPALFLPRNVSVGGGALHLTMRHEPNMETVTRYRRSQYHTYTSASVVSRSFVLYGYFEIEARAMASAGSSAWWFTSSVRDARGRTMRSEIDVFELGGRAPGHEDLYHMNAHIFRTPEEGRKKWNRGGAWKAPFNFADDFHVFGLEWTPEHLVYYVDGVVVRRMPNTHWHAPLRMIFDSETMLDWLGDPAPSDLPSTFSVNYVRAWKNRATRDASEHTWDLGDTGETDISRWVKAYDQQRR